MYLSQVTYVLTGPTHADTQVEVMSGKSDDLPDSDIAIAIRRPNISSPGIQYFPTAREAAQHLLSLARADDPLLDAACESNPSISRTILMSFLQDISPLLRD